MGNSGLSKCNRGEILFQGGVTERERYWNDFYSSTEAKKLGTPSQFAAFIAQEAGCACLIIEVGCGTGKDSLFFSSYGFDVVAIDGSEMAIRKCQAAMGERISFVHASVGSADFLPALCKAREASHNAALVYARFFLHALTDNEERAFFGDLAAALRPGDRVALEYRTVRDATGEKVTPVHYRRYIEPFEVFASAGRLGFVVEYAVEGFGYAKYKQDDAYVARCILKKP